MRIGSGFDVHAFAGEGPVTLGGCQIPHSQGLAGHSDADVLLHAVTDAILGALALGDIGKWFPPSDDQYKGIDSRILLTRVMETPELLLWQVVNIDCTVIAQAPRISDYTDIMRENLATLLKTSVSTVSVKATTTEKLGFVGRKEGIAAQAVVLLAPDQEPLPQV